MLNFGLCVAPHHRVLRGDLTWSPIGDLKVGDDLIAFDESGSFNPVEGENKARYWRRAVVEDIRIETHPCVELTLEDGSTLISTKDHRWLIANSRSPGLRWVSANRFDIKTTPLAKFIEPWEAATDYESGWLSGMLDGEGSFESSWRQDKGASTQLKLTQNAGPVMQRWITGMRERNFDVAIPPSLQNADCQSAFIRGGFKSWARAVGSLRPTRMLNTVEKMNFQFRLQSSGRVRVVSRRDIGMHPVVLMKTSTGTYICEGYGAHNCYEMGYEKLGRELRKAGEAGVTDDIARGLHSRWHETYPGIKTFSNYAAKVAEQRGYVTLWPSGRYRRYKVPGLLYPKYFTAANALIQGAIAEIIKHMMVLLDPYSDQFGARLVLNVHDELVYETPIGVIDQWAPYVHWAAAQVNPFDIEMPVEMKPWIKKEEPKQLTPTGA